MKSYPNGWILVFRGILSVITGLAAFFFPLYFLWGAFGYNSGSLPPDWFWMLSLFVETLLGLGAGFVTFRLIQKRSFIPLWILAGLLALLNIVTVFFEKNEFPLWPYVLSIFLVPASVLLGGCLSLRSRGRSSAGRPE